MKYSKPSLRCFDSDSEMICVTGSAASTSGCTVGGGIGMWCGFGTGNTVCGDGSAASGCYIGSTPLSSDYRCQTGYTPS